MKNAEEKTISTTTRWSQERRLEFIDFRLLWDRSVNRGELVEFFGISTQQASTDLAMYMKIAPQNIEYDKSQKAYRATAVYKPIIAQNNANAYLNELIGLSTGTINPSTSLIGWRPVYDLIRYPTRPVQIDTLLQVLWAIRDGQELQLTYQSMRRPKATVRWISPHAIAFDGFRWHTRAWCHENQQFRDFVISRIQYIHGTRTSEIFAENDTLWSTYIDVIIQPHDGLTDEQRCTIENDYGMVNGRLVMTCRQALVFYLLRQLQLDKDTPNQLPIAQPLVLVNRNELTPFINDAQKVPEQVLTNS